MSCDREDVFSNAIFSVKPGSEIIFLATETYLFFEIVFSGI